MAKGKSKPDVGITQLNLFKEEQPAEAGEVNMQAETKQTEQQEEVIPLKKRARNKKTKVEETPSEIPAPEQPGSPVTENVSIAAEENSILPQPADAEQPAVQEARLKDKYKKIQEERLAALKKARGVK